MVKIRIRVSKKVVVEINAPGQIPLHGRQLVPFVSVVTEKKSRSTAETLGQRFLLVPKEVGKQPRRVFEDFGKCKKYLSKEAPRRPSSCGNTNLIPSTSKSPSGHHCVYNCPTECPTCWKVTRAGEKYGPRCICKIPQPKSSTASGGKAYYSTYIIGGLFVMLLWAAAISVWRTRGAI